MRQPPSGPSPARIRGVFAIVGVFLAFVVIAVLLLRGGLPRPSDNARAAATPAQPTATTTPLKLTLYDHLNSIDMRSPTEGWIVGSSGLGGHTYVLRFLHGAWVVDPLQIAPMNPTVIKMVSATEGWIAGSGTGGYDSHGIMLHILNGKAIPVTLPDSVGQIESLAMVSPSEGWAVDSTSFPNGNSQILHYSQGVWAVAFTVPGYSQLLSIAMVSPTEGWAAGIGGGPGAFWRYAQGQWRQAPLNDPQQADLEHISMLSPTEGWGIGGFPLPHHPTDQYARRGGAIWHYSGGVWQVVKRIADPPSEAQITDFSVIQAIGSSDVWVSEFDSVGKRFLHGVNGTWLMAPAAIRDGITSIAMLTPSDGWAVGAAGQIMQCRSGVWFDYPTL